MGKVLHFSGRPASGRLFCGDAKLVALRPSLEPAGGNRLKLQLPQRGHRSGGLPVTQIALINADGSSSGDLGSIEVDELGIRHATDYGDTHMCSHINSGYEACTIYKMEAIGNRIRALRKALGMNQVDLAEALGVNQSTVSDIENGAAFEARTLMRLSAALLKSPQFIMTGRAEAFELSELEAKMVSAYRKATPPVPAPKPEPAARPKPEPARPRPQVERRLNIDVLRRRGASKDKKDGVA